MSRPHHDEAGRARLHVELPASEKAALVREAREKGVALTTLLRMKLGLLSTDSGAEARAGA